MEIDEPIEETVEEVAEEVVEEKAKKAKWIVNTKGHSLQCEACGAMLFGYKEAPKKCPLCNAEME